MPKTVDLSFQVCSFKGDELKDILEARNEDKWKVNRGGVRHVLFRVDSIFLILDVVKEVGKLREVGENIGKSAGDDILRLFDERKILPSSSKDVVELWNYWDISGGWGEIEHKQVMVDDATWAISVKESFLFNPSASRGGNGHNDFWKGYIIGFLNTILPEVAKLQLSAPWELLKKVSIFAKYRSVKEVDHTGTGGNADKFCITFNLEPMHEALNSFKDGQTLVFEAYGKSPRGKLKAIESAQTQLNKGLDLWAKSFKLACNHRNRSEILQYLNSDEKSILLNFVKDPSGATVKLGPLNEVLRKALAFCAYKD